MPDGYVPAGGKTDDTNRGPAFAVIADQTRTLRGFLGVAHGGTPATNRESDHLALEGKVDFIELLQFGAAVAGSGPIVARESRESTRRKTASDAPYSVRGALAAQV